MCTLECTLKEAFCSNCGQKKAEELKAATKALVAVGFGSKTLTFELRLFHEESELVCSQIDEVEFELTCLLDKTSGRWLLSVPGIVIALALIIAGEIGDDKRFDGAHQVLGLCRYGPYRK